MVGKLIGRGDKIVTVIIAVLLPTTRPIIIITISLSFPLILLQPLTLELDGPQLVL